MTDKVRIFPKSFAFNSLLPSAYMWQGSALRGRREILFMLA